MRADQAQQLVRDRDVVAAYAPGEDQAALYVATAAIIVLGTLVIFTFEPCMVDATGARALESTVTTDNDASNALFARFAERRGATETVTEFITRDHFPPDDVHDAELLHRIEPLTPA